MPEGYVCDKCGAFNEHTHDMSEIELQLPHPDGGTRRMPAVLCPECSRAVKAVIEKGVDK